MRTPGMIPSYHEESPDRTGQAGLKSSPSYMRKSEKKAAGCMKCPSFTEGGYTRHSTDPDKKHKDGKPKGWLGWCCKAGKAIIHLSKCPR